MNLVIDDAVEVKQITKTNDKEERKNLGAQLLPFLGTTDWIRTNRVHRPNPVERRQRVFDPELVRLRERNKLSDEISVQRIAQSRKGIPDRIALGLGANTREQSILVGVQGEPKMGDQSI